jgi:hypothetical protein
MPFVVVASIGAPLFAVWVMVDYWRAVRRPAQPAAAGAAGSKTQQAWVGK